MNLESKLHSSLLISCEYTLETCSCHLNINGMKKLIKFCHSEKQFLEKKNHYSLAELKSTNLIYIQGLLFSALFLKNVSTILKTFNCIDSKHGITVDVIFNGGSSWAKVITKNTKTLKTIANDQCQFGTKSIIIQAQEYLNLASLNPCNFKVPEIYYIFFHEVPNKLKQILLKMNVKILMSKEFIPTSLLTKFCSNLFANKICNHIMPTQYDVESSDDDNLENENGGEDDNIDVDYLKNNFDLKDNLLNGPTYNVDNLNLLKTLCTDDTCICKTYITSLKDDGGNSIRNANLDVTTMIALCSNLCHGGHNFKFKQIHLSLQTDDEKENPQLPLIFQQLNGKNIYACESAVNAFRNIIDIIGGDKEKSRAANLLKFVQTIPDQPSKKISSFSSSRMNERARNIFGTGDNIQAVTLTANQGFVRAVQQKGVELVVFLHLARGLSEQKEILALSS